MGLGPGRESTAACEASSSLTFRSMPSFSPAGRRSAHQIRYHDRKWAEILARARECGLSPATFVRRACLGAKLRTRRNHFENDLIYQLGRIAHRLDRFGEGAPPPWDGSLAAVRRIG